MSHKSAENVWVREWQRSALPKITVLKIKHLALDDGDPYGTLTRVPTVRVFDPFQTLRVQA